VSYLLVTEVAPTGAKKSWLLPDTKDHGIYSFGRSRTAHLRSRNTGLLDIEIAIETKSSGWEITHLDTIVTKSVAESADLHLEIKDSKLEFKVVDNKDHFAHLIDAQRAGTGTTHFLEIQKQGGKVFKTRLVKSDAPVSTDPNVVRVPVTPGADSTWAVEKNNPRTKIMIGAVLVLMGVLGLIPPKVEKPADGNKVVQKILHEQTITLAPKTRHEQPAQGTNGGAGGMTGFSGLKQKMASVMNKSMHSNAPRAVGAAVGANARNWGQEAQGTAGVGGQGVNLQGLKGIGDGSGAGAAGHPSGHGLGSSGVEMLEDGKEIGGGLDREVIAQYIKSQIGQILYCYERQLSANPDLYGKVAVRFTIGSSGKVETQRIGQSTLRNTAVEGCILQQVARWQFPVPEGGTKVNVTYPFLFKSTN
jgi:TonB family protein